MKKTAYYLVAGLLATSVLFSCGDDDDDEEVTPETVTVTVDSSKPSGATTTERSGAFVAEAAPTTGSASIVSDEDGNYFVALSEDFSTDQATGTVSVFLAKSAVFAGGLNPVDPSNQMAIGVITGDKEAYFSLGDTKPGDAYTHLILWCSSASVQFANAELK